ncbi:MULTISPECIES: hypothetical protein [unclassified Micromonospora]|uniref:hypothetical protein n=1 Tax=unclassified Micromonospora TaxID=2617518 RepID=UPI0033DE7AC3
MGTTREPGSYEVRLGVRSALTLLLFFLLPVLLVVVGVLTWPQQSAMVLVGSLSCVPLAIAGAPRVRAIRHRRSIVAIDSRGVRLGRDDHGNATVLEPWPAVDAVVHFDARRSGADDEWERCVGVVRGGRIVSYRGLAGSRLNLAGRPGNRALR